MGRNVLNSIKIDCFVYVITSALMLGGGGGLKCKN